MKKGEIEKSVKRDERLFTEKLEGNGRERNRFYIVSSNPDLEKTLLEPTIPNNFLTRGKHEDWQIKRICLYRSIGDALSAHLGEKFNKDSVLYVYEPVGIKPENLIKPGVSSVPYTIVLPEWWYCTTLRLRLVKAIQIVGDRKIDKTFHYGPRQTTYKLTTWGYKDSLDKYGRLMVPRETRFSLEEKNPEEEKNAKTAGIILGASGGAHFINKGVKAFRDELANERAFLKGQAIDQKIDYGKFYKRRKLTSDASADIMNARRNMKNQLQAIEKEKGANLEKIAKQHKKVGRAITGATLVAGATAIAANAIKKRKSQQQAGNNNLKNE